MMIYLFLVKTSTILLPRFILCRVQAGCLKDATELALKSLEMVKSQSQAVEDLSSRHMYLYGHLAHIKTQVYSYVLLGL